MSRQAIINVCQKEGIKLQTLSRGWLFRLEKDGRVCYMFKNCLALNAQSSGAIAADKFATYEVLRAANIPIIDHTILYPFDNHRDFAKGCNTIEYLEQYFNDHNQDIVLKPNHGYGGQGITHITSAKQFPTALDAAFAHSESASLCPFYHICREYRVIMLDGEPRLVYGKKRGVDWRFNLQNGATSFDVSDPELYDRLTTLAQATVRELDLRFCSVDIIELESQTTTEPDAPTKLQTTAEPDAPTKSQIITEPKVTSKSQTVAKLTQSAANNASELLVIEVNSAAETTHYCEQHPDRAGLVEAIYRDAILTMFE